MSRYAKRFDVAEFEYGLDADIRLESGDVKWEIQYNTEDRFLLQLSWTDDGMTYKDLVYYEGADYGSGPFFGAELPELKEGLDQIQALVPECVYKDLAGRIKAWSMGLL